MRNRSRHDAFGPQSGDDPRLTIRTRPNPWEWLRYSLGGGLSPQLSQWVLKDTTGRTWWARHLLRAILQMSPLIIAIMVFLPGPVDLRIYTSVLGLFTGLFWAVFAMWGTTEHRLIKAGFAPGEGETVRQERSAVAWARRREKWGWINEP